MPPAKKKTVTKKEETEVSEITTGIKGVMSHTDARSMTEIDAGVKIIKKTKPEDPVPVKETTETESKTENVGEEVFDAPIKQEVVEVKEQKSPEKNLIIAMPVEDKVDPFTFFSITYLLNKYHGKVGFDMVVHAAVIEARNTLANRFLQMPTKPKWLLFMDSDIIPPIGVPAVQQQYFGIRFGNRFDSIDAIQRLVSHGKGLVSGIYFKKQATRVADFAEAITDKNVNEKAKQAPMDEIMPTSWAGAGCLLINRAVLERMVERRTVDKDSSGRYGFFTPDIPNQGEDVAFFSRAKKAGIQGYVDLGCVCGHVGKYVYR